MSSAFAPEAIQWREAPPTELFVDELILQTREQTRLDYLVIREGQRVGAVGLNPRRSGIGELDFLSPDSAENEGVIARAARELIDYAFAEFELNAVELRIRSEDKPGQRVAKILGARFGSREEEWPGIKRHTYEFWEVRRGENNQQLRDEGDANKGAKR